MAAATPVLPSPGFADVGNTGTGRRDGAGRFGRVHEERAEADGGVFLVDTGAFTLNPHVVPSLPFSPQRDFLPIALLSNLLTLNEAFIYTFSTQLMWFWTGLMLFIMVKEIHNYSVSETVRNVLTTLFTMAMFLLAGYILYVLFNQLYEFILAIIQEVGLRG